MTKIRYEILNSVTKIGRAEWDSVFGDIPEGYQFHKTLEESNLGQFSFCYIVIRKGSDILLIAPLFIGDINLDILAEGFFSNLIQRIRKFLPSFFVVRTLFCGSPFGENGTIGIRADSQDKDMLIHELANGMNILSKKKNIPLIIFKDFLKRDARALKVLSKDGFFRTRSLPSVVTDIDFDSMDDYFKSLSPSRRKDLNRKLKKTYSNAHIEIKISDDVDRIIDDVYRLYVNTYLAGKIKFEKLTKDFFIHVARNMKPHVKFFLYYVNGALGAFNLCFVHKDLFIDKFIGFNYDISYKHNLYFISWCFNVEWCIKKSIRRYQTGQTDYRAKISLGGRRVSLYAYVKHRNFIYNPVLKLLDNLVRG